MHSADGVGRAPRLQKRPGTTRHVVAPPSQFICHRSPDLDKEDTIGDRLPPDSPQIGAQNRKVREVARTGYVRLINGITMRSASTLES